MPEKPSKLTGPRVEATELAELVKTYALQETVGPLKQVARTLALGSAAAVMLGFAAVLSLVGLLRALQGETGSLFLGEWNWAPYALTAIAAVIFLGMAAAVGLRAPRTEKRGNG
jgi:hypothetical protein